MDSTFDNLDFDSVTKNEDINNTNTNTNTEYQNERPRDIMYNQRTYTRRTPVRNIPGDIYINQTAQQTELRLKELADAGDHGGVVQLVLKNPDDLLDQINQLKVKMADILEGRITVPIGKQYDKNCHFKLACERIWSGDHKFNHTIAEWIITFLFKDVYSCVERSTKQETAPTCVPCDEWDVEVDDNTGYYQHKHPNSLYYNLRIKPRENSSDEKIVSLFKKTVIEFYAGKRAPRIGATKVPAGQETRWCRGPFCYQTLTARDAKEAATACKNFHNYDVSFLTSIARVLVSCEKLPKPHELSYTPVARAPRVRYAKKETVVITTASSSCNTTNAFTVLQEEDSEPPVEGETPVESTPTED